MKYPLGRALGLLALAVDSETVTAEKVILAAGSVLWLLWALATVLALVLAVVGGS